MKLPIYQHGLHRNFSRVFSKCFIIVYSLGSIFSETLQPQPRWSSSLIGPSFSLGEPTSLVHNTYRTWSYVEKSQFQSQIFVTREFLLEPKHQPSRVSESRTPSSLWCSTKLQPSLVRREWSGDCLKGDHFLVDQIFYFMLEINTILSIMSNAIEVICTLLIRSIKYRVALP